MIHQSADVASSAQIGSGTRVWNQAQVRERAVIGRDCVIGKDVYVDTAVTIGDRCKLENGVSIFQGFELADGVFVGPGALLLNDRTPRAINLEGGLKTPGDWTMTHGYVETGASIGGGAILLPGVRIGAFAMVGAGAVVTRSVPAHGLVYGNPARLVGFVCTCGVRLQGARAGEEARCAECGRMIRIPPTE